MAQKKGRPKAQKKTNGNSCKKGWIPVEIDLGKKRTLIVCGRVVTAREKKRKKAKPDWVFGGMSALDVLGALAHGLSHSH